jgi:hypothetical protein
MLRHQAQRPGIAPGRPRRAASHRGWRSHLKGVLIGYGKKKGLRSKIVEWTP